MKTTTLKTLTLAAAAASFGAAAHGTLLDPPPDSVLSQDAQYDEVRIGAGGPPIASNNFTINNGATLTSTTGLVSYWDTDANVTLREGSKWVSDSIQVGGVTAKTGMLTVENGTVEVNRLQLGSSSVGGIGGIVFMSPAGTLKAREIDWQAGLFFIDGGVVIVEALNTPANRAITMQGNGQIRLQSDTDPSNVSLGTAAGVTTIHFSLNESYGGGVLIKGTAEGTYTGTLKLTIGTAAPGFRLNEGDEFKIFENLPITLAETTIVAAGSGQVFNLEQRTSGPNVDTWLVVVPEPSTYALIGGLGVVVLAMLRRRRGKFCA